MYAVIRSGGKQARVSEGDLIDVELLKPTGDEVSFTPLLVVDDDGKAMIDGPDLDRIRVTARVVGDIKGRKIRVFKYKNKSGYRRTRGHRQRYTRLEILNIGETGAEEA